MTQKDKSLSQLIDERSPSLKRLEQSKNRVDRQIIFARERSRKSGNRVKFLVGAAILNRMKKDESFRQEILAVLDNETTRLKDRVFLNENGEFNLSIEEQDDESAN